MQKYHKKQAEEQYKEIKQQKRKYLRNKKRRFHKEQTKQAENLHIQKERRFYWLDNDIRKEFRSYIKA
jgi:hypothetical protein